MKQLQNYKWHNWSSTSNCSPERIYYPRSIHDVIAIVEAASNNKKKIRVVGAGHSFTNLVMTDEWLLSLDNLSGVKEVDYNTHTVTVYGGTRLYDLSKVLEKLDFAQENLGDINVQSIAGAISTGTHGTGIKFGSISTQVKEITFVTAGGKLLTLNEENNQEIFKASLVSLGMFGIIIEVKIRVVPSPVYRYISDHVYYPNLLKNLETYIQDNQHFEFFMFPYADQIQTKTMNPTNSSPKSTKLHQWNNLIVENYMFQAVSHLCLITPGLSRSVSRLSSKLVSKSTIDAKSYKLFATPRIVRFVEMEYGIPLKHFKEAIQEIRETIVKNQYTVHFPIECRIVKHDDIWLSPSYMRDSAYIAFHVYKGMEYRTYFRDMEAIMKKYNGRPHWGKMHQQETKDLRKMYPKWDRFIQIRQQIDPEKMFVNRYLDELFYSDERVNV
ncbi:D-arabinono-1,4-lactone oxidase [Oceanobacillus sp. 1P07AA]|uniref:D-arabinono-1,4-lactone oxidase n=1 Tax=Oceanobacillus sp. 1P07AA TaxID=3132293 RepID=UPI0039A5723C